MLTGKSDFGLKRAIVYCRVSTMEQVEEGNSLATQEKLCLEYALKQKYEVIKVFIEKGESAKTAERTELQSLLGFCSERKNRISAVIVYKIDRLSRNTADYGQIKTLLKSRGAEIRSVTEAFEDNPFGRYMENNMASIAQLDNDIRAERCTVGMKEAVRSGRYVWKAPIGYKNVQIAGKSNIEQSELAPIMREAFEIISKGLYSTEDVRKMMFDRGLKKQNGKPLAKSYFYTLLKNPIYAGVISVFNETHKGSFEPIISLALFNQVQKILKNKGRKISEYKKDNDDFPLRRIVKSPEGLSLTGSWSKGRDKKYPYYRFEMRGSNYKRDDLEEKFMSFMDSYSIDPRLIGKLKRFVKEKLIKATTQERKNIESARQTLVNLEEKENLLIEKNLEGVISDVVLKNQLEKITNEKDQAELNLTTLKDWNIDIIKVIEFTEEYLKQPSHIWRELSIDKKTRLQWFQFPYGVVFDGQIFGTKEVANVFKTKETFLPLESDLVDPTGLEPATPSLQMMCSTR
ncbi:MAG: site-specific DNA recombinase [Parcubacteria bacterium C7867-003]|nr:MAG: site-specific DNA recombinase [Parcubacteria bacterium C7867-003]